MPVASGVRGRRRAECLLEGPEVWPATAKAVTWWNCAISNSAPLRSSTPPEQVNSAIAADGPAPPGRATDAVDRGGVVVVLQVEPQRTAPARRMDRSCPGSHESGPEVSVRCSREHAHPGGIGAGLIVDLRTTEPGLVGPGRSNLDRPAPVGARCADSP